MLVYGRDLAGQVSPEIAQFVKGTAYRFPEFVRLGVIMQLNSVFYNVLDEVYGFRLVYNCAAAYTNRTREGKKGVAGDSDSVKLEKPLPNSNITASQSNQNLNNNEDNAPRCPRCGRELRHSYTAQRNRLQYSGILKWEKEGLAYQKELRHEWA
jgi:hypothetical protein